MDFNFKYISDDLRTHNLCFLIDLYNLRHFVEYWNASLTFLGVSESLKFSMLNLIYTSRLNVFQENCRKSYVFYESYSQIGYMLPSVSSQ